MLGMKRDRKVILALIAIIGAIAVAYIVIGAGSRTTYYEAIEVLWSDGFDIWTCEQTFDQYVANSRQICQKYPLIDFKVQRLSWPKFHDQIFKTPPSLGFLFTENGIIWFDRPIFTPDNQKGIAILYYCKFNKLI